MTLGPLEVVVITFPGNRFSGEVLPELSRLIETDTIGIVDGLLVTKDDNGEASFAEIDEKGLGEDAARLAQLCNRFDEILTDDDVAQLTVDLESNSSAALLVFEHRWVRPLRDAIIDSGGVLATDFRVPSEVVADVLAALETTPND